MAAFHEGKLVVFDNICIFLCDLHGSFCGISCSCSKNVPHEGQSQYLNIVDQSLEQ